MWRFIVLCTALAVLVSRDANAGESSCTAVSYASNKPPSYPPSAILERASGKTTLRVTVSTAGVPQDISIEVSSGNAALDTAAKEQVAMWRFEPSRCSGRAVATQVLVPFDFELTDDVLNVTWEFVLDSEKMETPTVLEELAYLSRRDDLEKMPSPIAEVLSDKNNFTTWIIVQKQSSTGIMRVRFERNSNVYRGLYSTMCIGDSDWCARFAEDQVTQVKAFMPPPPPLNGPYK
jgi:TonB family protein